MACFMSLQSFLPVRQDLSQRGLRCVFTNGCFDLLHAGHIHLLKEAKKAGDFLVVGLNSDTSVHQIKGDLRPILHEEERATILCALSPVDAVILFEDPTPLQLIRAIVPDVLVKGADWGADSIVGSDIVLNAGGIVHRIDLVEGISTTGIVERILTRYRS